MKRIILFSLIIGCVAPMTADTKNLDKLHAQMSALTVASAVTPLATKEAASVAREYGGPLAGGLIALTGMLTTLFFADQASKMQRKIEAKKPGGVHLNWLHSGMRMFGRGFAGLLVCSHVYPEGTAGVADTVGRSLKAYAAYNS